MELPIRSLPTKSRSIPSPINYVICPATPATCTGLGYHLALEWSQTLEQEKGQYHLLYNMASETQSPVPSFCSGKQGDIGGGTDLTEGEIWAREWE